MTYEMAEDKRHQGEFRVEAIDHEGEGECLVVIFSGAGAEQAAGEYLRWKEGQARLNAQEVADPV